MKTLVFVCDIIYMCAEPRGWLEVFSLFPLQMIFRGKDSYDLEAHWFDWLASQKL